MTDRILSVQQVADMLGCSPETVRERTPHDLPGAKFGRDWVYVESQVIAAVSKIAECRVVEKRKTEYRMSQAAVLRGKPLPRIGGSL